MDNDERKRAALVLGRVSAEGWQRFWGSSGTSALKQQDEVARATLRSAELSRSAARYRPADALLDLLGDRLLNDSKAGFSIRRMILEAMPAKRWDKLATAYREKAGKSAKPLHGNMAQHGSGSKVMSTYWRQGSKWAHAFCEITHLPECLAESRPNVLPADEEVMAVKPLPPLHDFQTDVYAKLRELLRNGTGSAGLLSLPTGAGKTRVAVEAVVDHLALTGGRKNVVIWVAQSAELQQQAWECFRQVWQTPPQRTDGVEIPRRGALKLICGWGSRSADDVVVGGGPTVLIAGIQQLGSWLKGGHQFFEDFPYNRLAAVVVDETHRVIAPQHRDVLVALKVRAVHQWSPLKTSAPIVGLTATPWRTINEENDPLRKFFQRNLLTPELLTHGPIGELQKRRILARVIPERLYSPDSPQMTHRQQAEYEQFRKLPNDYLETLGRSPERNGKILDRLLKLPSSSSTLVFACSVEHASILTLALNRAHQQTVAALVTGKTPRSERFDVLAAFRAGKIRFCCNVGVLTTGFDAPKVDVVCLTRPTSSSLLYEQMVGRGLRGPKNGGTRSCRVLDVQDAGLPNSIMSYARVAEEWKL